MTKNFKIVDHPLVQDKLSRLRHKNTSTEDFRRLLKEIGMLMTVAVTQNLLMTTRAVETPMTTFDAPVLANKPPVIIPILRAGLGLTDGIKEVMGDADFGHIGVYRDEETKRPKEYLVKLPADIATRDVILVDPMLATGHSAKYAIEILLNAGVPAAKIQFMVLVAAPEGAKVIADSHPDVTVYAASLDTHLDENAYIVPGLGDAGDRIFGTN